MGSKKNKRSPPKPTANGVCSPGTDAHTASPPDAELVTVADSKEQDQGAWPVPKGKQVAPLPVAVVESQLASTQKQLRDTERELQDSATQVSALEAQVQELSAARASCQDVVNGLQTRVHKLTEQVDAANLSASQAWLYAYITSASALACMGIATVALVRCRQ